jgi:ferredoxin/flavodoxin---NADP+ reductase
MSENTLNRPLRVAVIGAGPSGFYVAESLLKQDQYPVSIDLIDRLPTPYGLVRYGVAPDHQKIKSITMQYEKIAKDARVRFLGNVELGKDLTLEELKAHYDGIFYTVGASSDRSLGIPGENLVGSHSATEFVAWYNGHPDASDYQFNLDVSKVAVVGAGNVAIDVTRILAKNHDELFPSDIANHALEALKDSKVTDVYMLARRGVVQAKFTTKELRELGELLEADVLVKAEEVELDPTSEIALQTSDNVVKKNVEILLEFSKKPLEGKPRRVHLRFLVSPVEILGTDKVEGLRLEKNRIDEKQNAVGTGEFETLEVGMVLRSVGYKGVPLAGVPFDTRKGVIPNDNGRVISEDPTRAGEYVAGWIKRGPSGVVGSNKVCAKDTVELFLQDVPQLAKASDTAAQPSQITALLEGKNVQYVTFDHWQHLDKIEVEEGKKVGRPRVKLVKVDQMLKHLESVKG